MITTVHLAIFDSALVMQSDKVVYLWMRVHLYIACCWHAHRTLNCSILGKEKYRLLLDVYNGSGRGESSGSLLYFGVGQ